MTHRVRLLALCLCISLCIGSHTLLFAAEPLQASGFSTLTGDAKNGVQFTCPKACFISAGAIDQNVDALQVSGKITGSGSIGYGFLVGTQFVPGEMEPLSAHTPTERTYDFSHAAVYGRLPKDTLLALVFIGDTATADLRFAPLRFSLSERIL